MTNPTGNTYPIPGTHIPPEKVDGDVTALGTAYTKVIAEVGHLAAESLRVRDQHREQLQRLQEQAEECFKSLKRVGLDNKFALEDAVENLVLQYEHLNAGNNPTAKQALEHVQATHSSLNKAYNELLARHDVVRAYNESLREETRSLAYETVLVERDEACNAYAELRAAHAEMVARCDGLRSRALADAALLKEVEHVDLRNLVESYRQLRGFYVRTVSAEQSTSISSISSNTRLSIHAEIERALRYVDQGPAALLREHLTRAMAFLEDSRSYCSACFLEPHTCGTHANAWASESPTPARATQQGCRCPMPRTSEILHGRCDTCGLPLAQPPR